MRADDSHFLRFLQQPYTQYVIPVYQRNYDWEEKHCKRLLDDIIKAASYGEAKQHFIGSIVKFQVNPHTSSSNSHFYIIDGQQRITTISLLLVALAYFAKSISEEGLFGKIFRSYLINQEGNNEDKPRLKTTDNNEDIYRLILEGNDAEYEGYSQFIENLRYFKDRINKENYRRIFKGLDKLVFVEISLDPKEDDVQLIFESLNSTGLALTQADLIRNFLLMRLKRKAQQEVYKRYWSPIENNAIDEASNESKVSDFIRDYLTLKNKTIPKKSSVYEEFKNYHDENFIKKDRSLDLELLEIELETIKQMSGHYNKLVNPGKENDREISRHIGYINSVKVNVSYPFLMKVYDDYSKSIIEKQTFIEVLELIQSFVFRRLILNLPSSALNKIFQRLYEDVDANNYVESIKISLARKTGRMRFPNDAETKEQLKKRDVYSLKKETLRYILERLENHNNKERVTIDEGITIEHIFPQHPVSDWREALSEEDYQRFKDEYLHTIGNLTLSGNNHSLGNKSFLEKKEMNKDGMEQGYRYSRFWMNRSLAQLEKWDIEALDQRFEEIWERVRKIWPYHNVQKDEAANYEEVNIFEADDPSGTKLEYFIFDSKKHPVKHHRRMYVEVVKELFRLDKKNMLANDIRDKLKITTHNNEFRNSERIDESSENPYYIYTNLSASAIFENIKFLLRRFDLEDELIIKLTKE